MSSFRCFLKIPFHVITLSILLSTSFLDHGSIWLRTCIIGLVVLVAFIFTFLSQQKPPESEEDVDLSNELKNKLGFQESNNHLCGKMDNHIDQAVESISYSESESNDISFSSEDYSDMEWPYSSGNSRLPLLEQTSSPDFSDEESLIELEIPSGIYVASPTQTRKGKQEEESKEFITSFRKFDEPVFDFFGCESKEMLKQQRMLDLLREMNEMSIEEENLIEIDIAMGSIKCPRFEIEA